MTLVLSLAVLAGILFVVAALAMLLAGLRLPPGSCFAYAILLAMAVYALMIELAFALGRPEATLVGEALVICGCGWGLARSHTGLTPFRAAFRAFRQSYTRYLVWLFLASLAYLAVQAVFVPPASQDGLCYNLPRIFMMQQENTLFPAHYNDIRQRIFPIGFDILHYANLRFHSDYGLSAWCYLSYLCIVVVSYSLSLRISRRPDVAFVASLLAASAKLFVLQAVSVKNDIPLAAMALAFFLATYELLYEGGGRKRFQWYFLLLTAVYGVSVKTYFVFFIAAFVVCFGWPLWRIWRSDAPDKNPLPGPARAGLVAAALLCALFLAGFAWRTAQDFGSPLGPRETVAAHGNPDGLAGAAYNAFRYGLQLVDIPGEGWRQMAVRFHDAVLGDRAGLGGHMSFAAEFRNPILPLEDFSGFGTPVFLLALAATIGALFHHYDFAFRSALVTLTTFGLMSWFWGWMPWNLRFFSMVLVTTLPALALFLRDLGRWAAALRTVAVISMLGLLYAALGNAHHACIAPDPLTLWGKVEEFPWWVRQSLDRAEHYERQTGVDFHRLGQYGFSGLGLLVAGRNAVVFPHFVMLDKLRWEVAPAQTETPAGLAAGAVVPCQTLQQAADERDLLTVIGQSACLDGKTPFMTSPGLGQTHFYSRDKGLVAASFPPFGSERGAALFACDNVEMPQGVRETSWRWLLGPQAAIAFDLVDRRQMRVFLRLSSPFPSQEVQVSVNGHAMDVLFFAKAGDVVEATLPFTTVAGRNILEFDFKTWQGPSGIHGGRPVAALLQDFVLTPRTLPQERKR